MIINLLFVVNVNNLVYVGGLIVMVYDNVVFVLVLNDVSVYRIVLEVVFLFWLIVVGRFVNVGMLLRFGKGEVWLELVGVEFFFFMLKYM